MKEYVMTCPHCKNKISFKSQPRFLNTEAECYECGEDIILIPDRCE